MGSKCKTCGLTERSHHPCNEAGTLYPCPDEFHREMSIVQCQQSGCTATGLTRARVWWCAIHHPEHPMGPVPPTPPPSAMRHWQHDETGRVCDCVDCPGPRYHEVNEAFAEAHEKAMREKCGTPAPADDARPMVTGGGLIKFDRRADDASGAEAMREAFVAHMATVGVTDVAWTNALGPVGTRADHYGVMLSVEWERFAAGYRAALPARDDAVEEAARLREALLAQRKAWLDLPACGGTYCDEPDESGRMDCCQDATYHAAGEAIRAIDAALRREKGGDRG